MMRGSVLHLTSNFLRRLNSKTMRAYHWPRESFTEVTSSYNDVRRSATALSMAASCAVIPNGKESKNASTFCWLLRPSWNLAVAWSGWGVDAQRSDLGTPAVDNNHHVPFAVWVSALLGRWVAFQLQDCLIYPSACLVTTMSGVCMPA